MASRHGRGENPMRLNTALVLLALVGAPACFSSDNDDDAAGGQAAEGGQGAQGAQGGQGGDGTGGAGGGEACKKCEKYSQLGGTVCPDSQPEFDAVIACICTPGTCGGFMGACQAWCADPIPPVADDCQICAQAAVLAECNPVWVECRIDEGSIEGT
jgi:hypothetical protein